jgi:hypothetical protein
MTTYLECVVAYKGHRPAAVAAAACLHNRGFSLSVGDAYFGIFYPRAGVLALHLAVYINSPRKKWKRRPIL